MRRAFGVTRREFFAGFLEFAAAEVRAWGLAPEPPLRELLLELVEEGSAESNTLKSDTEARLRAVAGAWSAAIGRPGGTRFTLRAGEWPAEPMPGVELDTASARAFLARHPGHADLAEILLRRAKPEQAAADREAGAEVLRLLEQYAALRPVDPYPHRVWARLAGAGSGEVAAAGDERAYRHLLELDRRSDKDNVYALGIARNRRAAADLPAALAASERAVRMNPFDATVRELAAAIAVESGRLDLAEAHIEALVALEPDRPIHAERLAKVRALRAASAK
jgi:tetratricopeptide (TPR) repeat protein